MIAHHRQSWYHQVLALITLLLVMALTSALVIDTSTVHAADIESPDVEIQEVTSTVAPGDTLRLKIHVENESDEEDLLRVEVTLKYAADKLTIIGSRLNDDDDWVSDRDDGEVTVTFGRIDADESRSATLEFLVNPNLSDNTKLQGDAEYKWYAETDDGEDDTDEYEVLVLDPTITAQANITPGEGPAGTVYQIYANRFWPDEIVVTWLNTPDGVKALDDFYAQAGNPGDVYLAFDSSSLTPGAYSLVLHGLRSEQERVVSFVVQ